MLVSDLKKKLLEPVSEKRRSNLTTVDELNELHMEQFRKIGRSMEYSTPTKRTRKISVHRQKHEDEIQVETTTKSRKSLCFTPLSKSCRIVEEVSSSTSKKLSTRRKSILKTPSQNDAGTPKKSIKFSKLVHEFTFEKDSDEKEGRKKSSIEERTQTDLQIARKQLHVSCVPNTLPCREKEYQQIYDFLEGKISDECGG